MIEDDTTDAGRPLIDCCLVPYPSPAPLDREDPLCVDDCPRPGPLPTELLLKFSDTEVKKQRRLVLIPMGRFGEASEMARAALHLASHDSSFMTGTRFAADGGITAAYVTPL